MKASGIYVPAISREVEFLARHTDEADEVWEGNVEVDASVISLLNAINERAELDVLRLLNKIEKAIDGGLRNHLRVKWGRISPENWSLRGLIYNSARGPKRRVGSVGLYVKCGKAPILIGWTYPRSGLDGRRELARVCTKIGDVYLASDHRERYPDWSKTEDAVVWLEEKLSKRSLDEVASAVSKRATAFFKIAKPTLKRLAGKR